jgi:ABC-type amino acid transport substrate-binding protein
MPPPPKPSASFADNSPSPRLITPPSTLIRPGSLTFLSDTSYPPQESIDPATQKPVGFDIDVANALAAKMGLTPTIQSIDLAQIVPALLAKRGDAAISALGISADLQKQVAFVGYFQSGQTIMVRKGNPLGINGLSDLCGRKVAVQVNTAEQDTVTEANQDACKASRVNLLTYPTDTEAVFRLKTGAVDAAIDDTPVAADFVKNNSNLLEVAGPPMKVGYEGIAVDPKNADMLRAIQQAMLAIYEDGSYHQILSKWNLLDDEIPAAQIIQHP